MQFIVVGAGPTRMARATTGLTHTVAHFGAQLEKAIANDVDYEEITEVPAPYSYLTQKVQKGIE